MKCKKHPWYQAKRPPRVACPDCELMWLNPERLSQVLRTVNPNVAGEYPAALCRGASEVIDRLLARRSE